MAEPVPAHSRIRMHPAYQGVALILLVLGITLSVWWLVNGARQLAQVNDVRAAFVEHGIGLRHEIGFGGLIHDFKNAVLRPDEPDYRVQVEAHYQNAMAHLQAMGELAERYGGDLDVDDVQAMLNAYRERTARLPELVAGGASITEVDRRVRFNDQHALDALVASQVVVQDMLGGIVNDYLVSVGILIGVMVLLMSVTAGLLVIWQRQRRRALLLADENTTLSSRNVALSQFAGMAAHDLDAPVRQVKQYVSLLSEDPGLAANAGVELQHIESATLRMQALIHRLLDFAKVAFRVPERANINTNALLSEVLVEIQGQTDSSGAKITVQDGLPHFRGDATLIHQVFANLLLNSIKYAKEDIPPVISVTGKRTQQHVVFRVQDNGIGLDPALGERVFRPLQRLHGEESRYGGVGIGLAIASSVIEGHGGSIALVPDLTGPDKGCCIEISLPAQSV